MASTAKLVSLVIDQRKQSKDDGNSVNLRNLGIAETLPEEVIEMIKDEVTRYHPPSLLILTFLDWILDIIKYFISTQSLRN